MVGKCGAQAQQVGCSKENKQLLPLAFRADHHHRAARGGGRGYGKEVRRGDPQVARFDDTNQQKHL